MARHGSDEVAFLLIDHHNILGTVSELSDMTETITEDTTPLGAGWATNEGVGVSRAELSQSGWFDDAADGVHDALDGNEGADRVLAYALAGGAIGAEFTAYSGALQVNYQRLFSAAELHKANATYRGQARASTGVILHPLAAETADGDTESDSVDGGAQSSDGGVAFLSVTELTLGGYDSITVTVLDSADNMTFGALDAFAAVTTAPGGEVLEIAGTVERYVAVEWEFDGTGSDPSATFWVGFARG